MDMWSWLSPPPSPPQSFYRDFSFANAPLSQCSAPLSAGVAYVVVVLLLERYMRVKRGGRGIETKWLQAVHNLILCTGSFVMFAGASYETFLRIGREASATSHPLGGVHWFFCESVSTRPEGPLFFWSYIYYLSKYYELLDTVLQLLKGRPPPHFFLHVYHHSVVIFMSWGWLAYVQTLQFAGLLFNTAVHVVMYYYCARTARARRAEPCGPDPRLCCPQIFGECSRCLCRGRVW